MLSTSLAYLIFQDLSPSPSLVRGVHFSNTEGTAEGSMKIPPSSLDFKTHKQAKQIYYYDLLSLEMKIIFQA